MLTYRTITSRSGRCFRFVMFVRCYAPAPSSLQSGSLHCSALLWCRISTIPSTCYFHDAKRTSASVAMSSIPVWSLTITRPSVVRDMLHIPAKAFGKCRHPERWVCGVFRSFPDIQIRLPSLGCQAILRVTVTSSGSISHHRKINFAVFVGCYYSESNT